jgi:glycosyltransferase involved in cell wall biosynthesis
VASRVGQLIEILQDNVNGLLCPPGDAAALAAALERLRSEPGLRQRVRQAARASVLLEHTWDVAVRRIFDLAGINTRRAAAVPAHLRQT